MEACYTLAAGDARRQPLIVKLPDFLSLHFFFLHSNLLLSFYFLLLSTLFLIMPPKANKNTQPPQMVSDSVLDPDEDESSMRHTLEKLEIQIQKQENLNTHFANQIQANNELLQSSIQDIQSSFQLIFKELKEMKQSRGSTAPSTHELNNAAGVLGPNPAEGIRSNTLNHSPVRNNPTSENDRINLPFLHQKSMKLEFPLYNGSGIELKEISVSKETIQEAKCDVVSAAPTYNLLTTQLNINLDVIEEESLTKTFAVDNADIYGHVLDLKMYSNILLHVPNKSETDNGLVNIDKVLNNLFGENVNKICKRRNSADAYKLFEKMSEFGLNLYKLPWPPPHFYHIHLLPFSCIICQFKTWKPGIHVKFDLLNLRNNCSKVDTNMGLDSSSFAAIREASSRVMITLTVWIILMVLLLKMFGVKPGRPNYEKY